MTKFECGMTNGGLKRRFQRAFEPLGGGWGSIHDAFSRFVSIAFLPIVPRLFWQRVFVGLVRAGGSSGRTGAGI